MNYLQYEAPDDWSIIIRVIFFYFLHILLTECTLTFPFLFFFYQTLECVGQFVLNCPKLEESRLMGMSISPFFPHHLCYNYIAIIIEEFQTCLLSVRNKCVANWRLHIWSLVVEFHISSHTLGVHVGSCSVLVWLDSGSHASTLGVRVVCQAY